LTSLRVIESAGFTEIILYFQRFTLILGVPTDAERWRFLADHELSVVWYDSGASISWREKWPEPGKIAAYRHLSRGKTLEEAVDVLIERYNRKHGISVGADPIQCVQLEVRGWVS
jgi:hypothetical protein